jgi:hypothetical protein
MTNDKANEVLAAHAKHLKEAGFHARRFDAQGMMPSAGEAQRHMLWMAEEAFSFPPEKVEKKMRWLGFIQGVAWYVNGVPIDELKKQNMPDEEKTDAG